MMAMTESETVIMDLWDGGDPMEAICGRTGRDATYVRRIVTRYCAKPCDRFEDAARIATIKLAAAIERAGVHP